MVHQQGRRRSAFYTTEGNAITYITTGYHSAVLTTHAATGSEGEEVALTNLVLECTARRKVKLLIITSCKPKS